MIMTIAIIYTTPWWMALAASSPRQPFSAPASATFPISKPVCKAMATCLIAGGRGVDASLTVSDETLTAAPDSVVRFGIQYENQGATATGVTLVATLDANLAYHNDSSGVTPTVSGNMVTWLLPDLRLYEQRDFDLHLQVTGGTPGEVLPGQLELSSNETDLNPDDNTATSHVVVAKPPASGISVLNISSWEPQTLDPALATDTASIQMIDQLFAGLTRIDATTGQTIPDLASYWEMSQDGMTFTFTLQNGLTWSDGTALTAEHVRYGVLRSLDPATDADTSTLFTSSRMLMPIILVTL